MHIAYPLSITDEGMLATTDYNEHVKQLIAQLLFTVPGERVNLPTFGTPLSQLVFSPGNEEMITATQFLIQGALQQWLGTLIQVQAVRVTSEDEVLTVIIYYVVKRTQQKQVAQFVR